MMNSKSGIYKILNKINNKFYIGSAKNIFGRWNNHKKELNGNYHKNRYLQRSWNKYGETNFDFIIVEYVEDINNLIIREQYYLDSTNSYNKNVGYNISPTAGSTLGVKYNDEAKNKISKTHKGKKISQKQRLEHSKRMKGKNNPFYGKKHSEETKLKMSLNHADLRGEKSGNAKLKISDVLKIREMYSSGNYLQKDLVKVFNINQRSISNIIRYKTWKNC